MTKAIITSASNKFFPSLINLLGSIKANYPNHPHIYVYDLGLFYTFRKEIESVPGVTILTVPHFVSFWRSCYTWKTYILNTPLADLNFYLDAGNQVLRPLDEVFEKIKNNGYLAVGTGGAIHNRDTTPKEYAEIFNMDEEDLNKEIITAGVFGFKKGDEKIKLITQKLFAGAKAGLTLGFSKTEQWKNKGVNKNPFIREVKYFRHDNTLLCILIAKIMPEVIIEPLENFDVVKSDRPTQYLWNLRLNYQKLEYISYCKSSLNKVYLFIFISLKEINRKLKGL